MRSRRLLSCIVLLSLASAVIVARSEQPVQGPIDRLKAGNERFVRDPGAPLPITPEKRQAQLKGQSPFAIIASCSDSRVPTEVIFNVGLGDLFIIRTAGEVMDKAALASIEYGAEHLHSPLLVVMGHEACGAVKATLESKPGGPSMGPNLDALVAAIRPGFARMEVSADLEHLREAIFANVEQVINDIFSKSEIVKHLAGSGQLQVVGAFYELSTGRVRFSEPVAAPKTADAVHKAADPAYRAADPADHR